MKDMLAKFAIRKSIGLAIGERDIALSMVAFTPLGRVEIHRGSEPCSPDQLDAAFERLLAPLLGRDGRTRRPILLALPTLRVFYTTRPLSLTNSGASPLMLLQEVLQTPNSSSEDMAVELVKSTPAKRLLGTLASCRKKYLSGLIAALVQRGARVARAEPAACSLLRLAADRVRPPRGAKMVARIFLGTDQALGVLAVGQHPMLVRAFDLPAGREAAAILAALSGLRMLARSCGIGLPIDAALIHGRPDLGALYESEDFQTRTEARLVRSDSPGLDAPSIALGAAFGASQTSEVFDLARGMKPPAPLRETFPWGEAAIQFALLFCAWLFLSQTVSSLGNDIGATRAKAAKSKWLGSTPEPQLRKEKASLETKTEAAENFLSTRIDWASHTSEIAHWLPKNVNLLSIHGLAELSSPTARPGAAKRSLVLHLSTPIPENGAVDRCLASLREQPLLKRDFPLMKLADMKWSSPFAGKEPFATFSVVCQPAAASDAAGKPAGAAGAAPKPKER